MQLKPRTKCLKFAADLVTFTEEIVNEKLFCAVLLPMLVSYLNLLQQILIYWKRLLEMLIYSNKKVIFIVINQALKLQVDYSSLMSLFLGLWWWVLLFCCCRSTFLLIFSNKRRFAAGDSDASNIHIDSEWRFAFETYDM